MTCNNKLYVVGNGFFAFLFKNKEDKDIVFQNGPYFFGNKGDVSQQVDTGI